MRQKLLASALLGVSLSASAALHIVSATWGQPGGAVCDARPALAAQCEGKPGCQVYADSRQLCPSAFNGWKEAVVSYTCDGHPYTDRFPETAQIALPAHDPRGPGIIPSCPGPAGANPPGPPPTPGTPPAVQPPAGPPPGANRPGGELVQNPGVRPGAGAWTVVGGPGGWYKPSNGGGEVSFEGDGVRFRSASGNSRYGVIQNMERDVSGCSSLILSATVRNDLQTLSGTGYNGRESPIAVFVNYTDVAGMLHEQLSENPNEPRNMFWQGFYYVDATPPSISQHGIRVGRSSVYSFSVNLAASGPKPRVIHFLGAEGGGWGPRDGKLLNISLQCH